MINTEIKEVSLYRSGCFISREGTVTLKAGKHHVEIATGSNALDTSTVRLALPEEVTGSNVQVELLSNDQMKEQTRELNEKLSRLDEKIQAKQTQLEMWTVNADFSSKDSLSIVDMSEYIDKLPERLDGIHQEISALQKQKEELQKQLDDKKKELSCYFVSADVEVEKDGEYPVQIRYYDVRASWNPIYELHTSDENNILNIRLKAGINQSSFDDWKQIKLTLFSGNPAVSGTIPELRPNRINIYDPDTVRQRAMFKSANGGAKMMNYVMEDTVAVGEAVDYEEAPMMQMSMSRMAEVTAPTAAVKQNDTMMEYELPGLWDVRKGNETKADISNQEVECDYHIIAIPKLDDAGYLAAEVKTSDIEDLLQTNAIVYHKGAYLGEVYLNPDMTKDTYNISLGRDESIRLKRDQKKKYTSNVMLKGQKKTEYEYELRIASTKNKACKIKVTDQIPVSQDKTVVVEQQNISGGKLDEKTGMIDWTFDLEAGATKDLTLAYSIAWPKDKMINQ